MSQEWILSIKEQCHNYGSAFFFKQWGTWGMDKVKRNKKANGRLLLGQTWSGYPTHVITDQTGEVAGFQVNML
jgi:protein gp37